MLRPAFELADIFRRFGHAFRAAHALSRACLRVMRAIEVCRTAVLGGHVEQCGHCSHSRVAYNSCRNRHCPKCQNTERAQWVEERKEGRERWTEVEAADGAVLVDVGQVVYLRVESDEHRIGF